MRLKGLVCGLLLTVSGWLAVAPALPAAAHDDSRCRGCYECRSGGDRSEFRRREILRNRVYNLTERVRLAQREGAISRSKAHDLDEDLRDVRDFVRNDRALTDSEFDRRMDDLDEVDEELREHTGSRFARYYRRYDRGNYRYEDRYDPRYDRRTPPRYSRRDERYRRY